jgi:hypothetical protein
MGGDAGDAPDTGERSTHWTRLRVTAAVVGLVVVLTGGAILWRHLAEGDGEPIPADYVPEWVAGYVANPHDTGLIVVVEACEDWNIDETMVTSPDPGRVEVYISWWAVYLSGCNEPDLRPIAFSLSEPLGDRSVFYGGGGEIPPFEGELPLKTD